MVLVLAITIMTSLSTCLTVEMIFLIHKKEGGRICNLKILTSISKTTDIVLSYIKSYHQQAKTTIPGQAQPVINHLDDNNPYLLKYRGDQWLEVIKRCIQ